MAGNTFGRILRLTTFGESHGAAIGGILDGCPAGIPIDEENIPRELDLRKPGQGLAGTARRESDTLHLLSGVFEGLSEGTPIAFYIANEDQRSRDYGNLSDVFRPGHADFSYFCKYGGIRDYRGGGRSSGRETAARVAGGAIAKKILAVEAGCEITAACVELGGIAAQKIDLAGAQGRPYFAADPEIVDSWNEAVRKAKGEADTLGGLVLLRAAHVPSGLGEPVFDKLDAVIAHALMGVGAVKGVEIGDGFAAARAGGASNNDVLLPGGKFASNHAGGIAGGISTGQDILARVAVRPIASIPRLQQTIDRRGERAEVLVGGRHDLSAIPRIVPVLSAMLALALADALLLQKRMQKSQCAIPWQEERPRNGG